MFVAQLGREVQHGNRQGYADPLSQQAQARYFLQRLDADPVARLRRGRRLGLQRLERFTSLAHRPCRGSLAAFRRARQSRTGASPGVRRRALVVPGREVSGSPDGDLRVGGAHRLRPGRLPGPAGRGLPVQREPPVPRVPVAVGDELLQFLRGRPGPASRVRRAQHHPGGACGADDGDHLFEHPLPFPGKRVPGQLALVRAGVRRAEGGDGTAHPGPTAVHRGLLRPAVLRDPAAVRRRSSSCARSSAHGSSPTTHTPSSPGRLRRSSC